MSVGETNQNFLCRLPTLVAYVTPPQRAWTWNRQTNKTKEKKSAILNITINACLLTWIAYPLKQWHILLEKRKEKNEEQTWLLLHVGPRLGYQMYHKNIEFEKKNQQGKTYMDSWLTDSHSSYKSKATMANFRISVWYVLFNLILGNRPSINPVRIQSNLGCMSLKFGWRVCFKEYHCV